ncbi:Bacterial extracellular solute-binding protein, family 3 [Pseudodesulfovibrio hydrargyri]|uniref:Bacterial extracellular solute-binding protein, family 3 n=1 Tax=Pseudodesulfovibrio hydrargyri TaxID=2125990 RepID=A0A1J5NCR1_9BACT|nr:transporter substrate-binding domain-containing protein [Pseudodesulfovibrio hydrargyri]OIQ49505.1 Bacterial extracellular solute-binding protein, family 3 [Pseudodesulfovibrio hydrargyri]
MRRLCPLLILFLLLGPVAAGAEGVRVITEFNPPFNFDTRDGASGIATDLFLRMADRAGLKMARKDIRVWPWARGYKEILEKPDVILYAMARTPGREGLFQWIGPIMPLHSGLFALRDRKIVIKDPVEDAGQYRYGTMRASASEQELVRRGLPPGRMDSVHDRAMNIRKLVQGRIDILVSNEPATFYTIRQMGLDPDKFEVVHRLMSVDLYFAASPDMDPAVVRRLQSALDGLKADGTVARIIKSYR